jgi:hypothetical protein
VSVSLPVVLSESTVSVLSVFDAPSFDSSLPHAAMAKTIDITSNKVTTFFHFEINMLPLLD